MSDIQFQTEKEELQFIIDQFEIELKRLKSFLI